MSFQFNKQPDEVIRIGANFRRLLESGDSIASATYVVKSGDTVVTDDTTVAGSGKITNQNPSDIPSVNNTASIQIESGDSGFAYKLTVLATTASGDKYEADINTFVLDL